MAGGGREKGWLSGMTQSFVIYTAGLCPWERQDSGGEHRPWGQPACVQTPASLLLRTYGNLGKLPPLLCPHLENIIITSSLVLVSA